MEVNESMEDWLMEMLLTTLSTSKPYNGIGGPVGNTERDCVVTQ